MSSLTARIDELERLLEDAERERDDLRNLRVRLVYHRSARDPLWDRIFVETLTDMNQAAGVAGVIPNEENVRSLAQVAAKTTQLIYAEAVAERDRGDYPE